MGSEISIYCNASGYPTPEVLWYKDNRAVEVSDHIRIIGISKSTKIIAFDFNYLNLFSCKQIHKD